MKTLTLFIASILLSTSLYAQKLDWGIKGGLNLSTLSNASVSESITTEFGDISIAGDAKMKPSFHIGVFLEFPISNIISLQPEVVYSRQGTYYKDKINLAGQNLDYKAWMRFNYINIPVIFKFNVYKDFSIDLGPQIGFVTDASVKTKVGNSSTTEDLDRDDLNAVDVSFAIGLSYRLTKNIDVSGRWNVGITDTVDSNTGSTVANRVIQLGVGYRF